jgi:hypothetical protein
MRMHSPLSGHTVGSGSLAFPAPLLDLEPLPARVLEVFPPAPPTLPPKCRGIGPHGFCASLKALTATLAPYAPWQARIRAPPSVDSSASTPPPFDLPRVHSHKSRRTCFGSKLPSSVLVPSSWLLTTSTFFSAPGLRVYCAPLPALRFAAFPVARFRPTRRPSGFPDAFHTTRFKPFKGFPSSIAVPVSPTSRKRPFTTSRCPLVVAVLADAPMR